MASIAAAKTIQTPSEKITWTPVTEADTPVGATISGGRYTFTVEGAYGGTSIELQYSKAGTTYGSIDATNLTFTSAGTATKSWNIEIGSGFVKPVRTGGASTSVSCYLTPIL